MKKLSHKIAALGSIVLIAATYSFAQTKRPRTTKSKTTKTTKTTPVSSSSGLTDNEMVMGLKDALSNGVGHAIKQLGQNGGFYDNIRVKIQVPEKLKPVEKTLRFLKQDDVVDDFVVAMNRAAEQAVVEATLVFVDSVKQMTFQDAKNIITGPEDSATQFFRRTSEETLRAKFLPIVKTSTEEVGVTAQYKDLVKRAGPAAALFGQKDFDLDAYITQKALDGLFLMIADEEKRIRENPLARTTSILKKVFGGILK